MVHYNKVINTIIILFLLLLFGIAFLTNISFDMGDVGLSSFSNALILTKAHQNNETFSSAMSKFDDGYKRSYIQNTFNYPLSAALLFLANNIFGVSAEAAIYISLFSALGAIIISFYLGSLLYNRLFGLIIASLIAMDVYFNVNIKTGAIIFSINVFVILGALYFFMRAHLKEESRNNLFIIISGFFVSICLFNGYPQPYSVLVFLMAFFAFIVFIKILVKLKALPRLYQKFRILSFKGYSLFLIFALVLSFLYSFAWDYHNDVPFLTTYKQTAVQNVGRFSPHYSPLKMNKAELKLRIAKFSDTLFLDMDRDAYFSMSGIHSDTAFPGQPIIPYVSGVFFFLGLYYIFKRRREADLLLLIFVGITAFIIIFIFRPYAPRVYIFSTPFLLMVAALGYLETFSFILNKIFKAKYQFKALLIISLVLVLNFSNYDKITKDFEINRTGQKIWSAGQARIYDYLQQEKVNERSLVVFAGSKDVYAWLHFIYIRGRVIPTTFYMEDKFLKRDFSSWIKNVFNQFDTIYFVFPSEYYVIENPGGTFGNYGMKRRFKPFLNANPNIQPAKIIYAKSNIPLHYIYKINKNDQYRERTIVFKVNRNKPVDIRVDENLIVAALYVNGPLQSIIFDNGDSKQRIPLNLTKNMDCYIDFGRDSIMEFYPDFDSDEPFENVVVHDHMQEGKGGFRLEASTGQRTGTLIYKFALPFKIIRADVRTSPRIFNDYLRLNQVEAFYSVDDKNYRGLYRVVSNGNVRYGRYHLPGRGGDRDRRPNWSGFDEYATYNVLEPNSNQVYFKFILKNARDNEVQLLSFDKTMFFKIIMDTSGLKRPIIKDNTKIKIETDSNQEVLVYLTLKPKK